MGYLRRNLKNRTGESLVSSMAIFGDADAHERIDRLLMPAFGTFAVKGMMEEMRDIASQLVLKWERFGPASSPRTISPASPSTPSHTAPCRTDSTRSTPTDPPEFAIAMGHFLVECGNHASRPHIVQAVMRGTNAKYEADRKKMRDLADSIVAQRRARPIPARFARYDAQLGDPNTGQTLSEESIAHNLLTFLIAGHETSSGMMTFMVYYLLKNPETMRKLRAQVDEVLGDRPVQYEDFDKLTYLVAVMREALRLSAPAALRNTVSLEDTTIGNGKYAIKKGDTIIVQAWELHRDPAIWGDDSEFRPERMMDGKFEALPPNAWQPFGFGLRACIGRAFAWQEVLLVMSTVIQKFDLSFADPSYNLHLKQTLTLKPKNFYIRASLRVDRGGAPMLYAAPSSTLMSARDGHADSVRNVSPAVRDGKPLYVLYGSNTGTSEAFAQRVANAAVSLPFLDWQTNTYQRIPALLDDVLVQRGRRGSLSVERGMRARVGYSRRSTKEYLTSRSEAPAQTLEVKDRWARQRHLEFELPEERVRGRETMSTRFGVSNEEEVILSLLARRLSPVGMPIKLFEVLTGYVVELSQPATKRDLDILGAAAKSDTTKAYIEGLKTDYNDAVQSKRVSVFNTVENHPDIELSIGAFLQMLPSMRVRQCSISSSPLRNPASITFTVSVLDAPALSGT
ncbi:Fatty acid hydroxylase [Mycena chlorophos]|uniref:Fatty acid hydroxylase n=1 Tax=Mycena chlorophos TaxID=658473 RepID=A0A8H6VZW6_MYCCL|nr:Fatty acid hydroxylase [Mycena chlorophos]